MEIIQPSYHPAQDAIYGGRSWRPALNTPTFKEREYPVLSVQPFRAGGYEATLRFVDLQAAADRADLPRRFGPRVESLDRSQDSINVSRHRAKAMVRKRIKDMGGNRLCTLTMRQSDLLGYPSPEKWAKAFARFIRLLRRAGLMGDYVAILEPHKKGLDRLRGRGCHPCGGDGDTQTEWDVPLHMHIVTCSLFKMPINLMRKCWLAALDGRDGNIDVQWLRSKGDADSAVDKVAGYATKYITKGLAEFERFNKKRYWSAGKPLLPRARSWLRSRDLLSAFNEAADLLRLTAEEIDELLLKRRVFFFPDGCGMWLNVRPSSCAPPPPF